MALSKPTAPYLQRGNPLSQGLSNFFPLTEGSGSTQDTISGTRSTPTSGVGWKNGDLGYAAVKNSSTATITDSLDLGIQVNTAAGTVSFRVFPTAAFNSATIEFLWGAAVTSGTFFAFGFQRYSDNNFYVGWFSATLDSRLVLAASAANWAQNQWQTYTMTWSQTGTTLYRNGIFIASNALAASNSNLGVTIQLLNQKFTTGSPLTTGTAISDWACWNRVLSPADIAYIAADPYAMIRSKRNIPRPLYPDRWEPSLPLGPQPDPYSVIGY